MFEFKKLCREYENLSALERGLILAEKSAVILTGLKLLDIPGIDPVRTLAAFLVGSAAADGEINEKEYLLIYPSLVKVFGNDFDFASVKEAFKNDVSGRKEIANHTENLMRILNLASEELAAEVVILCLCVVSIDGKISIKRKELY